MTAAVSQPITATIGAQTLPALLLKQAAAQPDAVAFREKKLGLWQESTWATYARRTAHAAAGLLELGVERGDRIAIHAENRPEWLITDLAAQGIGAVSVGIYPTSPEAEVEYLLNHSDTVVLIAEDEEQLDKALAVREKLPKLRKIVVIDTRGVRILGQDPMVITYAELEALGAARGDAEADFARRVNAIDQTTVAIIVYTSGTTGPPKGAMISHRNLMAAANTFIKAFHAEPTDDVLSYLPLSHIAERLTSEINALTVGYTVNFGEGGESFMADMRDIQPTIFLGVPRVWEKMLAGVQIRMQDASRLKRAVGRYWETKGKTFATKRMNGRLGGFERLSASIGWVLYYRPIRDKLGLRRVRVPISGAAPIAPQVLEYFWSLGVPIREGYGQTEGTAVATYMPDDDVRIGTVGRPLPGVELRIGHDGEILVRSPAVFTGYFKNLEATAETVDGDGWLHTGDVGELDRDGFLKITDRKKDIIITAGGKNISPSEIENRLKVSPYVREAIVIGDRRKYLTALIGIEGDTVGDWASRRNVPYTTYGDLSSRPEVTELIGSWVEEVNAEFAQVETIKYFRLLPKELDQEEGELTATQKVKRAAIAREFESLIEEMYR